MGVTVATTTLFAVIGRDPDALAVFADALRRGPQTLSALPEATRAATDALFEGGFTAAFLTVAGFAMLNAIFAWTSPLRKL